MFRRIAKSLLASAVAVALLAATPALADGRHGHHRGHGHWGRDGHGHWHGRHDPWRHSHYRKPYGYRHGFGADCYRRPAPYVMGPPIFVPPSRFGFYFGF